MLFKTNRCLLWNRWKKCRRIYHATFNPDNGKFTPSKLAAKIGSPGFFGHPSEWKILYSVGRWDEGSGALGYHIGKNGELSEFTRMICPDGGSAHSQFIQVENFSSPLSTEGFVALFPLDANGQLGEPTVTEHQGGSKVVDRRQDSPSPLGRILPDGKYALIPDLGLDQIVIYKVDTKKPAITEHGVGNPFPVEDPATCDFPPMGNSFIYLMSSVSQ